MRPRNVCVAAWFACLVALAPAAGLGRTREPFSPAFIGTIDLALALRPDTESVLVIDGLFRKRHGLQTDVDREVRTHSRPVGVFYLRDLPLHDVVARVAAAPDHSVVLFIEQNM